jgi:probable rRNA maturation factor
VNADPPGRTARVELSGLGRFPATVAGDLGGWVESVLSRVAPDAASFTVRFVGDAGMRRLNRVFRGLDRPTDVLSFPGAQSPEGRHLGDVVVSIPHARRQAREEGHSLDRELRELVLHGILHCLGHDHETDDGEMDRLERRLRRRLLDDA